MTQLLWQAHSTIQTGKIIQKQECGKSLPDQTAQLPRQSYSETTSLNHDSYKISPKPNTDGMGNCLQQPGQLSNQPHKSMRSKSFPLIELSAP